MQTFQYFFIFEQYFGEKYLTCDIDSMTTIEQPDLSKLKIKREETPPELRPPRPRVWILFYGLGVLSIIIAAFLIYNANFGIEDVVELTKVTPNPPNQPQILLTANGYVTAQRKAAVASKATGRLVYLGFEEGDKVKKGEVIGRIESADVEASLEQAKANLKLAESEYNDAEQSYFRAQSLFESNLISKAELDAVSSRFNRVKASIASAKAAVKAAEVQVENTFIRAPFDGTILTKNADIGEVVAPFAAGASSRVAIVTIADMNSLEVEADVSEANIVKIELKQPCEIVLDAFPSIRYRGYLHKIVPTADRTKATVLTKVRFKERDDRVLPEMSAKVYFLSEEPKNDKLQSSKLYVDTSAITVRNGKTVLFIFKENRVEEFTISLGERFNNLIEIKNGITAGTSVVRDPSPYLRSGARVKIKGS